MDRELDIALKEIRARISQVDPLLVRLISFAVQGSFPVQYGIAVRLGGATVFGIASPTSATGEALDKQTLRFVQIMHAMDVSADHGDKAWSELENQIRASPTFTNAGKYDDEAYGKLLDHVQESELTRMPNLADLPDDLVDTAIYALTPPKALTLTSAVIQKDNGTSEKVDNIRINLSSIEAWWPFELAAPEEIEDALARIEQSGDDRPPG